MKTTEKIKNVTHKIKKWFGIHTFWASVFASILASLVLGIVGFLFVNDVKNNLIENSYVFKEDFYAFKEDVLENAENSFNEIHERISEIETRIVKIERENTIGGDGIINNGNDSTITINNNYYGKNKLNDNFENNIQEMFRNDETVFLKSVNHCFEKNTAVTTDLKTGQLITVGDINTEPFIIHYVDDGQDVFFNGQFSENGYWDGNCLINRYKDNKLVTIMEAEYDSGVLKKYKQVFTFVNSSGQEVWAVADREMNDDNRQSGETYTYYKNSDLIQSFNSGEVAIDDLIDIEGFKKEMNLIQEGYYNGYISNGLFNDSGRNAYLVKYDSEGYVRFLYVGNIVDGMPNDDYAWVICLGYDNENYYFYKGEVKNGKCVNKNALEKKNLEEINDIVSSCGINFNCSINWKTFSN